MSKLDRVLSLIGCVGWCISILLINLGSTDSTVVMVVLLSFVLLQRASLEGCTKTDWIKLILAGFLGVGLFVSINELVGFDEFVFSILSNKLVAASSTILVLLLPYRAILHERRGEGN